MEHMEDKKAPDSGVVVCPQCDKNTPEHYMIWDGEKNTVCMWCDDEEQGIIPGTITEDYDPYDDIAFDYDCDPNPYHGTYSEE